MEKNIISLKDKTGLSLTVTNQLPGNLISLWGGRNDKPSWDEYLTDVKDEFRPHFMLIKKAIRELGWVGEKSKKALNTYFVFSDGVAYGFSGRAWGDLMSAIVNKNEGYMQYYL